ncbi:patatin-like phospholipase family protein [Tuwongella immobilis]|uniref:PNPLA domain-containing protein n=1 Tax=Tuwongella immobilis TaxID=692036 RepID=A0A6C2YRV0_9BACT|nr:patatin-like phospholipase family protein [Tuwongella immobilis]VIP04388.1 patatin : Patatin OS=Burkholderia phymatum (strain DSM 17167 / STM815) GN=Bphy_6656 PE=4 SV=1: Patatin [Tuwongella immobilis]VTS06138.1 patatin : Patatin OS=Burkholderia phymatum (strain DSM 17167 / STM815) GN=Bphy_6656 PE=4 SV=1: Patatin [Tuwongella immobilis]
MTPPSRLIPTRGLLWAILGFVAVGCHSIHPDCPRLYSTDRLVSEEIRDLEAKLDEESAAWMQVRNVSERISGFMGMLDPTVPPQNYLALSGGGKYGAFTVGILKGWTDSGTRPTFDVVTGVSTGAMIATFAYLGPQYDELLLHYYSSLDTNEVLRKRGLLRAFWSGAMADSKPLAKTISEVITPEVVTAVAAEHRKGRGLYVGTTDLNTRKLIMWDMGEIACRGDQASLELYRKIILASASVPGYFPPVKIDVEINGRRFVEYHADGGATASAFFRSSMMKMPPGKPFYRAGSNLYIIVAGKRFAEPSCPGTRLTDVASNSISSMLYAASRNDLIRMFTLCLITGMNYQVVSLPQHFQDSNNSLEFTPKEMQRLIRLGYEMAVHGRAWNKLPPETSVEERDIPRVGTKLKLLRNPGVPYPLTVDDGKPGPALPEGLPHSDPHHPVPTPGIAPGSGSKSPPTAPLAPPMMSPTPADRSRRVP